MKQNTANRKNFFQLWTKWMQELLIYFAYESSGMILFINTIIGFCRINTPFEILEHSKIGKKYSDSYSLEINSLIPML